jgi:hypothetical protein
MNSADKQIYFLLTGRWFRAPQLSGPWTYATNDLPEDFKRIPADSDASAVLASVPGTSQAQDAVLLAEVPTSVVVKTSEVEAKVKVSYYGEPQFKPIEGTSLSYATNTSSDVIKVDDKYYLCDNAIQNLTGTSGQNTLKQGSNSQPNSARTPSDQDNRDRSTQDTGTQDRSSKEQKGTRERSSQSGGTGASQEVLNGLNQDASSRKRGSDQANFQKSYQGRSEQSRSYQSRSASSSRFSGERAARTGRRRD